MDPAVEEIIKNIIHIDKGAVKLKEKLEEEISERKSRVEEEIEKLGESIVKEAVERSSQIREKEMERARMEAEIIYQNAIDKAKEMEDRFLKVSDNFIIEAFNEIFIIG